MAPSAQTPGSPLALQHIRRSCVHYIKSAAKCDRAQSSEDILRHTQHLMSLPGHPTPVLLRGACAGLRPISLRVDIAPYRASGSCFWTNAISVRLAEASHEGMAGATKTRLSHTDWGLADLVRWAPANYALRSVVEKMTTELIGRNHRGW